MTYPTQKIAGEQVTADDFNDYTLNPAYTYGETITAGQALYLKASDGKVYKASALTAAHMDAFVGIALVSGVANDTNPVLAPGKVANGLSSLTAGGKVYLGDTAGALSTTAGTTSFIIGVAISTTAMLIDPEYNGNKSVQFFGDGSDGAVNLDGTNTYASLFSKSGSTYTALRDMQLTTLTVASGSTLETAGYKIYGQVLDNSGTIQNNGSVGSNGSGSTGGPGGSGAPAGTTGGGKAGGAGFGAVAATGGSGVNGTAANPSVGASGGAGGDGLAVSIGGLAGAATAAVMALTTMIADLWLQITSTVAILLGGAGGGGGGARAGGGNTAAGGGGGGGGGVVWLSFRSITHQTGSFVKANGGNGGNGVRTGSAGAGGGGGGGGGRVFQRARYYANSGTVQANGGTGGTMSAGGVSNGSNGSNGTVTTVMV